ncbi:hypothetical protein [[Clostridium] polysaccharolyticum]|uniref:Uncharacterized protein n=1 Tax=[Clostridium] polysaccharolyticum TaxID=29364 RepID=A0A1I0FUU2_9FIRM|nr:hypothetical protein [[Clostridium] polysaccharolyticum]SET62073.1 hypothetical protein SAMN04487772_1386 [[Clostridium] polysaccharolyticum]
MALTQLDEAQKISLRNRAKDELVRIETLIADKDKKRMIDDFKEKFSLCEIVYKVILEEHQFNKTGKHLDYLKVTMTQVPHALTFAGYDFDKDLLTKLFGAEEKIGSRSVKKLRDALTHSMNDKAVNELSDRYEELNGYMDSFLNKIRTFDAA